MLASDANAPSRSTAKFGTVSPRVRLFFVLAACLLAVVWLWRAITSPNADWLFWLSAVLWAAFAGAGVRDLRRARRDAPDESQISGK
jgi:hypothetical protein